CPDRGNHPRRRAAASSGAAWRLRNRWLPEHAAALPRPRPRPPSRISMTREQLQALEADAAAWLAWRQEQAGCPILLAVEVMSLMNGPTRSPASRGRSRGRPSLASSARRWASRRCRRWRASAGPWAGSGTGTDTGSRRSAGVASLEPGYAGPCLAPCLASARRPAQPRRQGRAGAGSRLEQPALRRGAMCLLDSPLVEVDEDSAPPLLFGNAADRSGATKRVEDVVAGGGPGEDAAPGELSRHRRDVAAVAGLRVDVVPDRAEVAAEWMAVDAWLGARRHAPCLVWLARPHERSLPRRAALRLHPVRLPNRVGVVEVAGRLAQEQHVLVGVRGPVGDALGHRRGRRPDVVGAQVPAVTLERESEHPREGEQILVLEARGHADAPALLACARGPYSGGLPRSRPAVGELGAL